MADKPVCVVLVVDDLGFGGAERQVIELANNMDRGAFDVHVCALSNHVPLGSTLRDAEHRLHRIPKKHPLDLTTVPRVVRLLRILGADIVHGFLFRAEIVSRLAGRLARTKLVIGSERNANRVIGRKYVLAYKLTGRCADLIIANSNAGAQSNAKIMNRRAADYRVVHNGVDADRFKPAAGTMMREKLALPPGCPVIGAFANFKQQKNHAMLFRAFRLVLDSFPDARLLLVGDRPVDSPDEAGSYQTQLDRLVDELQIRDRCLFLGHQKDVEHLYPACDVTALSSLHEGTPNVLLESMACGVPVVATDVCDNRYIIRDGEVGYLVAVGDEVTMADRMRFLLGNSSLRQEMGRNARRWVLEEFSSRRLAEKVEAVYLGLLRQKRGDPERS